MTAVFWLPHTAGRESLVWVARDELLTTHPKKDTKSEIHEEGVAILPTCISEALPDEWRQG